MMQTTARTTLCLSLSALIVACSHAPMQQPAPVAAAAAPVAPAPSAPTVPLATGAANASAPANSTVRAVRLPDYLDPTSAIARERSVYFDYDNFAVKPQFNGVIERQGHYLSINPSVAVKIEGNADERGSREYNLALGQKRAEAVVSALKLYGVRDSQLEAVSWGKEKPRALGHDEAAYAENRRADVVYPVK